MKLVFKFNGRHVNRQTAWDEVMDFAQDVGNSEALEYDVVPDTGIKLHYCTLDLPDNRIEEFQEKIERLADWLLTLSEKGVAELYKSTGERIFSFEKTETKTYAGQSNG